MSDLAAPPVSKIEKLNEPQSVNLQAQGEIKQQGTVCPPGYRPVVRPRIAQPPQTTPQVPTPSAQPSTTPVILPSSTRPSASTDKTPPKKSYQIALFVGSDAKSKQLLEWFNDDRNLVKLRSVCEFQIYTANNALYRTRYAEIVPTSQFPVVLFQDRTGGHVHAAGRPMIPDTAAELYSDLRQGYELYRQAREAQKTGAVKARGYSWDEAISPAMYLSLEDCPDGYCPVEPADAWRPGDRVRDTLFDEDRKPRSLFVWASAGELATLALIVVAIILLGFILVKRGF